MKLPLTEEQEAALLRNGDRQCPVCNAHVRLNASFPHYFNNKRTIMIRLACSVCSMWAVVSYKIDSVEMSDGRG